MAPRSQVRRFYDKIWNRQDIAIIPAVLYPNVTFRGSLGAARHGHSEFADYVRTVTTAASGYTCEIRQLVTEGDSASGPSCRAQQSDLPYGGCPTASATPAKRGQQAWQQ